MSPLSVCVSLLLALAALAGARPKAAGLEQKCKSGPVDLVFIIDSSRSVRPHEFETMRKFMIDIIHTLDVGMNATRVGVVQYSSQVKNEFSLKTYSKLQGMVKGINEIIPLAQGTMTGLAIRYVMNNAFTAAEGDRPNVPNVAVIVTDGRPQDRVAEVAAEARDKGIEIYAVGVARADVTSLRAVASTPFEDHVFLVESFDLIHQFGLQFQDKLCGMDLCLESDHGCEQICESSPGSFHCLCRPGYTLNEDGKTCTAIDLCAEGKHDCGQICIPSPGAFTCGCNSGFTLNNDKKTCTMIDYCSFGNHSCQHVCVSVLNGYFCSCYEGYTLQENGKNCQMIDLCAEGKHNCGQICIASPGSFTCDCNDGYTLNNDKKTCTMIDLCAEGKHDCEQICNASPGAFTCDCNLGFTLNKDKKTCTMIDLCAEGKHDCEQICNASPGAFTCDCNPGFTLNKDQKTCTMIDLCAEGKHDCDQICIPSPGAITCGCNAGFKLIDDKKSCTNIDLCNTVEHGCEHQCVSTPGSYYCVCPEGQQLAEDRKGCGTCRSANIDLVFIIDGSKSVRPQNFELVKQFVNQVVDSLDVSADGTRVGLVQYSSRVRTEFSLNTHQTADDIKKAVMNVSYMEKGTMTGLALRHMVENSFSEAEGARKNVPRVGLVFTDGRSQDDITEWAKKAKEADITMYAVGVGKAVEDELREIASEPLEKHFFYTTDFTFINQIAENLKLNVCAEESQGEIEVKDPCACDSLVEFQQATMTTLEQLTRKLAGMTARLEDLENQLLSRK
ncbi:matrilin-4 isoform X9 [Esox lucius]|uniref:matrilin-4 isoform X9 n=1 Tax=Esox lucius TaxID=8010 RepID=UPI0009731E83|nr:matrilin-4 isoform X9 [Esox lucius]